jgi:hypothetical protein
MVTASAVTGRETANVEAVRRMTAADPGRIAVRPARAGVPGITHRSGRTSGAPLRGPA